MASLIDALKQEMNIRRLPVIATGGYAALITQEMKAITAQCPQLTLEGLRHCIPPARLIFIWAGGEGCYLLNHVPMLSLQQAHALNTTNGAPFD